MTIITITITMKTKRLILLSFLMIALTNAANAQFYSSVRVYCYQYEKTVNDGISSKLDGRTMFYFVNFQNEMMGYTTESSLQRIKQRLLEDPDYYADRAIKNLADSYNKYKSNPASLGWETRVTLIKYYPEYSSSKYTYRAANAEVLTNYNMMNVYMSYKYWSDLSWGAKCYTFSRDREELIIWNTSNSEKRDYYKLVNVDSIKPNMDFLD